MQKDKYDGIKLANIDPNVLMHGILNEMDLLIIHLDLLGAITYHEDIPWVLQQMLIQMERYYDVIASWRKCQN